MALWDIRTLALLILLNGATAYTLLNITIDDTDPMITYSGPWDMPVNLHQSPHDYGGSHMLATENLSSATFSFHGVAVYFLAPRWPYSVNSYVRLDGGPAILVDMSVPQPESSSGAETVDSSVVWSATRLSNADHMLVVTRGSPNYAVVDGFIYTPQDTGTTDPGPAPTPTSTSTNASSTVVLAIAVSASIACALLLVTLLAILIRRRREAKQATTIYPFAYENVGSDTTRLEKGTKSKEHVYGRPPVSRPPRQTPPERGPITVERPRREEDNVVMDRNRSPRLGRQNHVTKDPVSPSQTTALSRRAHPPKARFSGSRAQRKSSQQSETSSQHTPIEPELIQSNPEPSEPPPSYSTPQSSSSNSLVH